MIRRNEEAERSGRSWRLDELGEIVVCDWTSDTFAKPGCNLADLYSNFILSLFKLDIFPFISHIQNKNF
jgi:hypothetical protein